MVEFDCIFVVSIVERHCVFGCNLLTMNSSSREVSSRFNIYHYVYYGRTLSDASMLYFADVFFHIFFIPALVGQTAERIFTKLSHVVDIRHHLRTY